MGRGQKKMMQKLSAEGENADTILCQEEKVRMKVLREGKAADWL